MPVEVTGASHQWLCNGREVFASMLAAIEAAGHSVCLESYIYSPGPLGDRFREALLRACQRGVRVRVLIDGLGSMGLPSNFWKPLVGAGGEVRVFNPLALFRLGIRDHRKLLVCDGQVAFIGGFNIATEYEGDGVTCGWCDVGLRIEGPLAVRLTTAFNEMFARASFAHKRFLRLPRFRIRKRVHEEQSERLLLSGPGLGRNPIKRALRDDLEEARSVQIVVAYFLPTWRLRRQLMRIVRAGGRVQLILAGKSDVQVSRLAAQSLYRRFLKAGIEIYEYQPQVLHAKLILIDDVVYAGSSNLDQRSLAINYELMVRFRNPAIVEQAREIFANHLTHCRQVTLEQWRKSRSLWARFKQHWSYFLLVRVDPYLARRQWRDLPD